MLLNYFGHNVMWYCWIISYLKTTGTVKNATRNSFQTLCGSLWQITMWIMNLWSYMTPRVIFIMSAPGSGKLWSQGCRIWWKILFDVGITNKFYWQIFLSSLYCEYHLVLTNVIVCVSFEEIYFEQSSPCRVLEWRSTIFLTFQHPLKISGTIFKAPPYNLWVFFLYFCPLFNC